MMVPGPTPLPAEVVASAVLPMIDERTPQFASVYERMISNLQRVVGTEHAILIFASSITGASEGVIQNLFSAGDQVLIAHNGYFGYRWVQLAQAFGLHVVEHAAAWGTMIDNEEVKRLVDKHPELKGAVCVHCETSTGVVNDIQGFAAATASILSIVDGASSVGSCKLLADEWGIDVVVSGGQKGLMIPPGLSFVSISPRAWRQHEQATLPSYYYNWTAAQHAKLNSYSGTPWTPAISLIMQFDAALQLLFREGIEQVLSRHQAMGRLTRIGMKALGLKLLVPDEDRHASVTTVWAPDLIDARDFVGYLNEHHGLQLAAGLGHLKDRIFRIGHCGYIDRYDIVTAVAIVETGLYQMGCKVKVGSGVEAVLKQIIAEERAYVEPSAATMPTV